MTVIHRSKTDRPLVTVRLGKSPATEEDDETTESALTQVDEIALGFVNAGRYPTIRKARVAVFERNPQLAKKVRAEAIAKARTPHAPRPAQEMGPLEADLRRIRGRGRRRREGPVRRLRPQADAARRPDSDDGNAEGARPVIPRGMSGLSTTGTPRLHSAGGDPVDGQPWALNSHHFARSRHPPNQGMTRDELLRELC